MKRKLLYVLLLFIVQITHAQTPVCGGVFTDTGGPNGNYAINENYTVTISPTNPGDVVTVTFTVFDTETNYDKLFIYDSNIESENQIMSGNGAGLGVCLAAGSFWGNQLQGHSITSTHSSGSLTFKFCNDNIVQKAGWIANVTCAPPSSQTACLVPTNLQTTTANSTSANLSWTENNVPPGTQWEYLVKTTSDTNNPTFYTNGTLVSQNNATVSTLNTSTDYKFFVRTVCSSGKSNWSEPKYFNITNACISPSQVTVVPTFFDAQVNFTEIGNATSWEIIIQSSTLAAPTSNSIGTIINATNHTFSGLAAGSYKVYVRSICSVDSKSFWKTSTSFQIQACPINVLSNLVACDTNFQGFITHNLNTILPSTTTGTVSFYLSQQDMNNQVNAIANPTTFNQNVNTNQLIFAREVVPTAVCDNQYKFNVASYPNCDLAFSCEDANPICNNLGTPFINTSFGITAPANNQYGCVYTQPNPTWFYLPISESGILNLQISQVSNAGVGIDVDYVIYGPFPSATFNCGTLTTNQIVACSYSASANEFPVLPNVVEGQYYLLMTTNFSNQPGLITINVLPNSTAAVECTGFRLNAFLDQNGNATKDAGEINFPLGKFIFEKNNDTVLHHINAPFGVHNVYENNPANTYDFLFEVYPEFSAYYSLMATNFQDLAILGTGQQTLYFPVQATTPYQDVAVYIVPVSQPRAGTTYKNKILYANLGSLPIANGTIAYTNDPVTTITEINETNAVATGTGFTFNYTNLAPFEMRTIDVKLSVPTLPTVAIGQLLTNSVTITPTVGDVNSQNNANASVQPIVAAYDPNDKTESHGQQILMESFNVQSDELTYTIRFENQGNASALDVRITDILDAQIDETSVRVVSASHPYILERIGNQLTFMFENIMLPVSVANTDIGKGYITFRIKLKTGIQVGSIVPNKANIYFDTNPPIITNEYTTEFYQALALNDFNQAVTIYPNPATDKLFIETKNEISSWKIIDMQGKQLLQNKKVNNSKTFIDVSGLLSGIYIVEIETENGKFIHKLVKK